MDSDNDEEDDFPTAELNDPVWSEEPTPNRQWLCIHLIPHQSITGHTPRPATPPLQPIQEEVLPKAKPTDVSMPDDLPYVINVPKEELYSDFESCTESVLGHQWWNDIWIWPVNNPVSEDH